jgi:hypothetical protein
MPQFDTFIFSSSLLYFFTTFFILLTFNNIKFLPRLAAILKLRYKISNKLNYGRIEKEHLITEVPNLFLYNLVISEKNPS